MLFSVPLVNDVVDADRGEFLDHQELWVPQLTASVSPVDLGTGSEKAGFWHRQGNWVEGHARIEFGASPDPGSGTYRVLPPFQPNEGLIEMSFNAARGTMVGDGRVRDDDNAEGGTGIINVMFLKNNSDGLAYFWFEGDNTNAAVSESIPHTWSENDVLTFNFAYPIGRG